eukprot:1281259-Prymnesium_polylepis.1
MVTEVGGTSHAALRPRCDSATRLLQPRSTAGCRNPSATSCRRRGQQQQVPPSSAQRRRQRAEMQHASQAARMR